LDGEADIIVVGGGNSGLPAAIIAKNKGAKVIVLEASGGMSSSLAMMPEARRSPVQISRNLWH